MQPTVVEDAWLYIPLAANVAYKSLAQFFPARPRPKSFKGFFFYFKRIFLKIFEGFLAFAEEVQTMVL